MNLIVRTSMYILLTLGIISLGFCVNSSKFNNGKGGKEEIPRVIVSSDIGGSDPDDFQSMIHLLMYADKFRIEGLIASPYGKGRITDIYHMIDLYEQDYPKLRKNGNFPSPDQLRSVTKQGAINASPARGWGEPTEGSAWIIQQARNESTQPLWILVWGGLEDLAQALHDAPDIVSKIRVYWIGGPNKKWSVNAYCYIVSGFPDLWMIENNSTYRGWMIDDETEQEFKAAIFYNSKIKDKGVMGTDFGNYYGGSIKMGDTPSVVYLLNGNPDQPQGESWGGSFSKLNYSAFRNFERNTTLADTVPSYSVVTWTFYSGEEFQTEDNPEIWMEIDGQRIDGFYVGDGIFKVRFVPKRIGEWKYVIGSQAQLIHGHTGEFISTNPWPGAENIENVRLNNWWSDRTDSDYYIGQYQGARTISRWREDFLSDWALRFGWISE